MRPGEWRGILSTDWLRSGWERVRQDRPELWEYVASWGPRLAVPGGFVSNLGSIPVFLWPVLPRDGWKNGYILHDYCYSHLIDGLIRYQADYILAESIYTYTLDHTPKRRVLRELYIVQATFRRFLVFRGLRWFGWFAWWRNGRPAHRALVCAVKAQAK
jgi:hypothetical protein